MPNPKEFWIYFNIINIPTLYYSEFLARDALERNGGGTIIKVREVINAKP